MFLYTAHPELNFVSIAISTMILATLGAVMDVAMSIASTINEIYTIDNSKTIKELFKDNQKPQSLFEKKSDQTRKRGTIK